MAVRIQLASNFQVVELTGESWMDIDEEDLEHAVKIVNDLGKKVINDIKTAQKTTTKENSKKGEKRKKDEPASEKQVKFAVSLGLEEEKARNMTKGQIWSFISRTKYDEW